MGKSLQCDFFSTAGPTWISAGILWGEHHYFMG